MIWTIYFFILFYFLLGFTGFYFINRKKDPEQARKNWLKFFTYFIIIHVLFFSIVLFPELFRLIAILIIFTGFFELGKLFRKSDFQRKTLFIFSIIIYGIISIHFFIYSGLEKNVILFSFLVLSIFDSFSQITGQLWGRKKIFPEISSNKTVGGFIGGCLAAIISGILFKGLITISLQKIILLATIVVIFAFIGDIATSYYKRKYNVKDFSNLIPGHGGFLDRFDSLIAGGAGVALADTFIIF